MPDRLSCAGHSKRQIDPVEQRLGTEFSRLSSLADCFDYAGCCECQARETLDVTACDVLAPRDVGERTDPAGSKLFEPLPGTRHCLEQCRDQPCAADRLPAAMMMRVSTPRRFISEGTKRVDSELRWSAHLRVSTELRSQSSPRFRHRAVRPG